MNKYAKQLEDIQEQAINEIRDLINSKGEESDHSNTKCLKVTEDDHKHNLSGGRYLTEINAECLVDNDGHQYSHYALEVEDLLSVIDYLILKYTK